MLRASINLGNPVLAQGTAAAPSGVTVDIARELGARVGVPVALVCFDAARESFEAINQGRADICFLAIDPAREETVAFTPPYAVIEGIFAVAEDSPIASTLDVDRPGVRIGVKKGSAYDLYLSRTLTHAEVVRGDEGVAVFIGQQLEVAAGHPGVRLLEPRFMEIQQAVGINRTRRDDTLGFLHAFVEELKAGGFIAEALRRAGRRDVTVAPPA
jgi:polar amino acid transport system substrate-binding protein